MSVSPPSLSSERLRLVCCSEATLAVDHRPGPGLTELLSARIPDSWPPELYDEGARRYNVEYVRAHPDAVCWSMWYIIVKGADGSPDLAAGLAGFKGPPSEQGVVEVGYGVLGEFQRRGIASEATRMLIDFAFREPRVTVVVAETYPELASSIGVMMRNRMRYAGAGSEPGVVRYEVSRRDWSE